MANVGYITIGEEIWSNLLRRQVVDVLCEIQSNSFEAEHQILLITFIPWYGFLINRSDLSKSKSKLRERGVSVITIPIPIPIPYYSSSSGISGYWKYSWYLTPFVIIYTLPFVLYYAIQRDIDILHARSYPAGLLSAMISKLLPLKYIFDPRSDCPEENITSGNWTEDSLSFSFWKRIEDKICIAADSVIAISETYIDHLENDSGDINFDIVPNNVDTELFTFNEDFREKYRRRNNLQDEAVIVYSGSMEPNSWNNPEEYAHTINKLTSANKSLRFLFLIPDYSESNLVKTLREYEVDDDIYMIEHPTFEEVPKYLSAADLSIYILDQYSIRLGTKFVEYCAIGLPPVINTYVGGGRKIIREEHFGGVINIFQNESDGVTTHPSTHKMIEDLSKNHKEYADRCRQYAVDRFSTKSVAKRYSKIYYGIHQS
jgi:glycosyltransferase involved in cell wall biosynthesis